MPTSAGCAPAAGLRSFGGDGIEPIPALPARSDRRLRPGLPGNAGRLRRLAGDGMSSCGASGPAETAFLQYTSGSTSFPRGVVITQEAVLSNLAGVVNHGLDIGPDDRCVSWLPFYHDMGLVGCMLAPMATQRSIDYLDTRDFAMRPRRWLELMTSTQATISFSPPFGYELCARRIRPEDVARLRPPAWRVAGIGAEPIRAGGRRSLCQAARAGGFRSPRLRPVLRHGGKLAGDQLLRRCGRALSSTGSMPTTSRSTCARVRRRRTRGRVSGFVRCGAPLPGHEVAIRDDQGNALPDLHVGRIKVRGPSVMSGYFGQPGADATDALAGRLARYGRRRIPGRRQHRRDRPAQGHDHHQRPQHLAAGHRANRGAAARIAVDGRVGVFRARPG